MHTDLPSPTCNSCREAKASFGVIARTIWYGYKVEGEHPYDFDIDSEEEIEEHAGDTEYLCADCYLKFQP